MTITPDDSSANFMENRPFAGICVGNSASLVRLFTERDIQLFAAVSGDVNPAHVDALYAKTSHFARSSRTACWVAR